jgi:hypothetical protein
MTNRNTLPEAEILEVLARIESGKLKLFPANRGTRLYDWSTYPVFWAQNGWLFCVFNDCGNWDYLEWIFDPDRGRFWTFEGACEHNTDQDGLMTPVCNYSPSDEAIKTAWKWYE